jgi:hypothetical protein
MTEDGMKEDDFAMAGGMVRDRRPTHGSAKGNIMKLDNYENQDPKLKFTMGDEKPANRVATSTPGKEPQSIYKREIHNLARLIQYLKKQKEDLARMTPTEAETSEITDAIDSGAYVSKEIEIGVKIRDLEKKLELAKKRYQFLFGAPQ